MTEMTGESAPDAPRAVEAIGGDHEVGWPLGALEMRILRAVWGRGSATVRDVLADIAPDHPVAYTTVMTVMSRLAEKGLLRRRRQGKAYYYSPALTQEELAAAVSQRLLNSLVAEFGELAIAQFAAQLERIDQERLRRLREAIEGRTKP